MKRSDFEIMAPVGSRESLAAALAAGTDAIYFGIGGLNMRSRSSANFTADDMEEIAAACAARGVKTYLTVNTVIYDSDTGMMRSIIDRAHAAGISAIIASDMAAILYARSIGQEVHISTQVNVSNTEAVRFYSQWADVMVLARELNLDQVAAISRAIREENICGPAGKPVRLEMFCHGALCMAVSGKCYLSLHEMNSSANRGFWDGYYLGQRLGEWSAKYGSSATRTKFYSSKAMRYFPKLGVGEFLLENGTLSVGDEVVLTGPTTGALVFTVEELRLDLEPVQTVSKGDRFSMPVPAKIRPSDRLYRWHTNP